jgi:DNA invertase Pin-like site-specific DNA recombinase
VTTSQQRGIKLSLGGQVYDPTDPMGKMFFNILATFAEFEVDLLRMLIYTQDPAVSDVGLRHAC